MYVATSMMLSGMPELASQDDDVDIESHTWAMEFLNASFGFYSKLVRYITDKGYIGQTAPNAKVGDKIALL